MAAAAVAGLSKKKNKKNARSQHAWQQFGSTQKEGWNNQTYSWHRPSEHKSPQI